MDLLKKQSHLRKNLLTGEYVLVSPHRMNRPWQGQEETIHNIKRPEYDNNCYLCPGNTRANGEKNPKYKSAFSFKNDYAALQQNTQEFKLDDGLFQAYSEQGICKVICFSPDHSKSLADMSIDDIDTVIQLWKEEFLLLGTNEFINYVQIFENKGTVMGCSNPHPHGQIWSQSSIPDEVLKKDKEQSKYYKINKKTLLEEYVTQELIKKERVIFENESFVVVTPFWAVWPFEVMIVPKKPSRDISDLTTKSSRLFAESISVLTKAYDKLFNCSFPYSSGIHQAPTNGKKNTYWHWHMSFYPPLLRSATVKKFMVGYELFATPQRDITAEHAAKLLRELI
ncbi:UDP-glucose--hexose-1-phosphate uridylyltransferase [Aquimarina longa]|uniref:UDP-glucose--hexose-1-phosphate uridylyltransferase n=1 Tax=Aquimarina longa TaxID=1080221 RepID=UPI0007840A33|nr:UDP-glucose--hexose-1-phosphate uridylyltransferase [Aquimarina longa]